MALFLLALLALVHLITENGYELSRIPDVLVLSFSLFLKTRARLFKTNGIVS